MAIGVIVGARLGHVLFYDPIEYLKHPLDILKIWEGGLASHGAAIGILISMYLFVRKYKKSYLWLFDRIVIAVALSGFFIRSGNLMNSEIYGVATNSSYGFIYTRDLTHECKENKLIKQVRFIKTNNDTLVDGKYVHLTMNVAFINGKDESQLKNSISEIFNILTYTPRRDDFNVFYPDNVTDKKVDLKFNSRGYYIASIPVLGIPKHPTQVYEATAYLLIFLFLYLLYFKRNDQSPHGRIFSYFLILVFGARFIIEFFKNDQSAFESGMILNMGQLLSIPFVLAGIALYIYSNKSVKKQINLK
jgi:prolipoprotein diacylglyceryltransferase